MHWGMMNSEYIFPATVKRVVDADTIVVDLSLGFGILFKDQTFRFYGINAYETKLYKGVTEEEKVLGLKAKTLVENFCPTGSKVFVETYKAKKGKYGRYLAVVWAPITESYSNNEFTPTLTLVGQKVTTTINNIDYFNLNYWLCANKYAIEKEY